MIEEIEQAISDYYAMIDYSDKEEMQYIRRAITRLKKEIVRIRKGVNNLS